MRQMCVHALRYSPSFCVCLCGSPACAACALALAYSFIHTMPAGHYLHRQAAHSYSRSIICNFRYFAPPVSLCHSVTFTTPSSDTREALTHFPPPHHPLLARFAVCHIAYILESALLVYYSITLLLIRCHRYDLQAYVAPVTNICL